MRFNESLLLRRRDDLNERGVRVRFIGRRGGRVPKRVLRHIEDTEALTAKNRRMTLTFAFNYGGRAELTDAVRAIAARGRARTPPGRRHRREDDRPAPLRARHARPGPHGAHLGGVPDLELPVVGERVLRVRLHRRPLAGLPPQNLFDAVREFQLRDRRFGGVDSDPSVDERRDGNRVVGIVDLPAWIRRRADELRVQRVAAAAGGLQSGPSTNATRSRLTSPELRSRSPSSTIDGRAGYLFTATFADPAPQPGSVRVAGRSGRSRGVDGRCRATRVGRGTRRRAARDRRCSASSTICPPGPAEPITPGGARGRRVRVELAPDPEEVHARLGDVGDGAGSPGGPAVGDESTVWTARCCRCRSAGSGSIHRPPRSCTSSVRSGSTGVTCASTTCASPLWTAE